MLKHAWKDIVNWQTQRRSNKTKFQVLAWMINSSRRTDLNQLENCQTYAHTLSWNSCIWHELDVLTFCLRSVNKLARAVTKWTQACDRRSARPISCIHHTRDYRQCCCGGMLHSIVDGFCSRLRHCWRPWGLEANIGVNFGHFRMSYIRPCELDM